MSKHKRILEHILVFILATLPLLLSSRLLWLKSPPVWSDEAVFTDIAKHIGTVGRPTTELYGKLIPGLSHGQVAYPPVYFYVLHVWMSLFGQSIDAVRLLSLFTGIGVLGLWYLLLAKLTKQNLWAGLGTLLLASEPRFQAASRIARMDILVLFFILLSILAYWSANHRKLFVFISGFIAALTVLTHPMGFLAPALLLSVIWCQKTGNKVKLQQFMLILLPLALGAGLWLSTQIPTWRIFVDQLVLQSARKAVLPAYLWIYIRQSPANIFLYLFYLLIVLTGLLGGLGKRDTFPVQLSIFTVFVVVTLILTKEQWYLIYLTPLFIVNVILSSRYIVLNSKFWKPVGILFIVIPLIFYTKSFVDTYNDTARDNYIQFSRRVLSALPSQGTICLSSLPDPYFTLDSDKKLQLREFVYAPTLLPEKFNFLRDCNAVVMNISPGETTIQYLLQHEISRNVIGDADSYNALVVILSPKGNKTP